MQPVREWVREKTEAMTLFVHRFSATASKTRKTPLNLSRKEAIYRIQQMDLAIDVIEKDSVKDREEAAVSAVACAVRAAILADLAILDIEMLQMLMESIVSKDYPTAVAHLDSLMDSAGFAGGFNEVEEKIIRLCDERYRREQVSFD